MLGNVTVYEYGGNGNLAAETDAGDLVQMTDSLGTTSFEADLLHQLKPVTDHKGNAATYETGAGSHNMDYTYNNLNQLITQSDDGWKTCTAFNPIPDRSFPCMESMSQHCSQPGVVILVPAHRFF